MDHRQSDQNVAITITGSLSRVHPSTQNGSIHHKQLQDYCLCTYMISNPLSFIRTRIFAAACPDPLLPLPAAAISSRSSDWLIDWTNLFSACFGRVICSNLLNSLVRPVESLAEISWKPSEPCNARTVRYSTVQYSTVR